MMAIYMFVCYLSIHVKTWHFGCHELMLCTMRYMNRGRPIWAKEDRFYIVVRNQYISVQIIANIVNQNWMPPNGGGETTRIIYTDRTGNENGPIYLTFTRQLGMAYYLHNIKLYSENGFIQVFALFPRCRRFTLILLHWNCATWMNEHRRMRQLEMALKPRYLQKTWL